MFIQELWYTRHGLKNNWSGPRGMRPYCTRLISKCVSSSAIARRRQQLSATIRMCSIARITARWRRFSPRSSDRPGAVRARIATTGVDVCFRDERSRPTLCRGLSRQGRMLCEHAPLGPKRSSTRQAQSLGAVQKFLVLLVPLVASLALAAKACLLASVSRPLASDYEYFY